MIKFFDGFAENSGEVLVYHFDRDTGEFLGKGLVHVSEGCGLAPGQALDAPPRAKKGHVIIRDADKWVQVTEHQGPVYSTETGEEVARSWRGELPEHLTNEPRPSIHHHWKAGVWELDQLAAATYEREQASAAARAYLAQTDWYVIRQQETGKSIPVDVLERRQSARAAAGAGHV